jgi:hypothetical protein
VGLQKSETILFDDLIFLVGNMNTQVASTFRSDFGKFSLSKAKQNESLIKKMMATD